MAVLADRHGIAFMVIEALHENLPVIYIARRPNSPRPANNYQIRA